jgi:hypothetical protein
MADKEKIKRILRNNVKPGKILTEAQITELADKLILNRKVDESTLKIVANEVVRDSEAVKLNAIDMSDVNDELKK